MQRFATACEKKKQIQQSFTERERHALALYGVWCLCVNNSCLGFLYEEGCLFWKQTERQHSLSEREGGTLGIKLLLYE